jgi:anti-sigma factor RsiW
MDSGKPDNDRGTGGVTHHSKKGCVDKLKKMSDYVDDELDTGAKNSFDDHLADCPPCLMVLKSLRKTLEIFRTDKTAELPEKMASEIKESVMRKTRGERGPA